MRILLSSREAIWGGGEVFLADLASTLTAMGHRVLLRVPADSELARRCPDVTHVRRDRPVAFDLLVANDFRSVWQSLVLDGPRRRAFVVHGSWQLSPLRVRILRAAAVRAFAVSRSVAAHATRVGMASEPSVLPLGPAAGPCWDPLSTPPPRPWPQVIGTVARWDPIKRLDLFGQVVQRLGVSGLAVTPTPATATERSMLDQLRAVPQVQVWTTGDAHEVWQRAGVFLSTSVAESLGLAHLEALQHRVPVLSTATGGPRDVLTGPLAHGVLHASTAPDLADEVMRAVDRIDDERTGYWQAAAALLAGRGPRACADLVLAGLS